MSSPGLPFGDGVESLESRLDARDREGRARAVDPRYNVALEASAGTGKTRVLVNRYVNLLKANVDPVNVLAVTFTRKAAAEMRERIMATLKEAAERGELTPTRWRELRDRTGDISVSTIDAFCLSLLREFPLEADLDPGFSLADETEAPRLVQESLDRALRTCRALAREDAEVALVFAQLGDSRARRGLAALLNRRLVAPDVLRRYLERGPSDLTVDGVVDRAARALCEAFDAVRGGLDGFRASGPRHPGFQVLVRHVEAVKAAVDRGERVDPGLVQAAYARTRDHFLTRDGEPRRRLAYTSKTFLNETVRKVHLNLVHDHGADILRLAQAFRRDLNVLVARGTARMYRVAETEYRRTLEAHAVLDFSDVLLRALDLVRQMEEFAQSRFRLESRYHHVLVDEFQDTSRAQWELVAQLVQAWGAGVGAAYEGPLPPSVFIVGDRKQSIYGFRDADVSLLQEASRHLESLRPDRDVRRSISRSFRSVAPILSFVNDVCRDIEKVPDRPDAFVYDEQDRFPLGQVTAGDDRPLGLVVAETPEECAAITADEIGRLLAARVVVRDRDTGVRRPITPADVAILFRTRESHREFETALERLGIAVHVYKGLGFFDADEIKDVRALLWSLADPASELRTAAVLRSGFVGLSDEGLRLLAPRLSQALYHAHAPAALDALDAEDRATLRDARVAFARWRSVVDRLPAGDLLEQVLRESGYAVELRGPRFEQARENLKKVRSLVRRVQNRGYATLARVAAHLDHLAIGDEANAPVDARDAVSLMTVHASKGLEFPVVFVVNLARGTMSFRDPIRVSTDVTEDPVTVGDFRSDTDQDQPGRDREETKRLLYVALTRARDRLYLGTVVKEGRMQPGRGSLGEVLPKSLQAVFSATASGDAAVWTASSGQAHRLTWCTRGVAVSAVVGEATPVRPADREPLSAVPEGCSVTEAIGAEETVGGTGVPGSDRLLGLAVHRLLDRRGFTPLAPDQQRSAVLDVLASGERAEVGDVEAFVATVADAYAALCSRDDLREMLESGQCFHEVPFSLRLGPRTVRGTVDCLVRLPDKRLVVLEFKTGRPRPEHEAQVALYCQAARTIFPDCTVEARLIYPPEA